MLRGLAALPLILGIAAAQNTEATLREQVRRDPASFEANHLLGEFYAHRGDLPAAIPYLRRAYQTNSADYDNAYDLALACLQTRALDEARRVTTSLMEPADKSELHNLLGDIEEASGNMTEAVRQYEMAARADPSEKNIFDLGSELLNHRGFEQAVQIFEFGTGRYPASAKLRVGLGVAYYSLGRYTEAVESLCKAVDLDPADIKALDFLGKMSDISPEMAEEVTRRLAGFAALYPNNASANYYYALSLRKRALTPGLSAREKEVEALLLRATRLNPQFADAHYQLAQLYEDQKRGDKAIAEYEAAVKLRPGLKSAHYHLSRLYASAGRPELARKELQLFRSLSR